MIVVRNVFRAKYGRGDELVQLFKEVPSSGSELFKGMRLLTDVTGPFFTVVSELEVESLTAWDKAQSEMFSQPDFGAWFQRMMPLVESGSREIYNLIQ